MGDSARGGWNSEAYEDEEALMWASLENLPTYDRLRTSIMKFLEEDPGGGEGNERVLHRGVDVRRLEMNERILFIGRLFKDSEQDHVKFLKKLRDRIDKVEIQLPTVEMEFENLTVEAKCYVPTLPNTACNILESALGMVGNRMAERMKLTFLKNVTGIVKPSRYTMCTYLKPIQRTSAVIVEIPFVLVLAAYYSLIVYAMVSFQWTAAKFFWLFFITFFSFLYFTYYGMMTVPITPNLQVASVFAAAFYSLFNLFSSFFIPKAHYSNDARQWPQC
ncbi:ABC transporter G family member 35-like protein [Drosera capensis]